MPLAFIVIIVVGALFAGNRLIEPQNKPAVEEQQAQEVQATSPTSKQTPTPTIRYSSPKPTIDSDPVIACQNPNCGPINIKRSLCSNTVGYVCCQVGNTQAWYASRDKCSQDQVAYWIKELKPYSAPTTNSYNEILEQHRQNAQRILQDSKRIEEEYKQSNQQIVQDAFDKMEDISNRKLELPPINVDIPTPIPLKIIQEPTPTCYPVMFPNGAWGFSC